MISFQFITAFFLIIVGLYGLMYKTNLIKMLISLTILGSGTNLLLISLGYVYDGTAPIFTGFEKGVMVNPLPQALTLTAIVIGVCVIALALSLTMQIYRHYGTLDVREIRKLKE
ncbi:MAG: NADH-quinone oxidoreductase subunit K, partial [Methanosarcinaceae archaeon]|jgi:multicomponent Na+:H+ antiporter subunit C|nr:NADH-quinone oxidoreductase subunit K [Methanosarcinaceae archaeon]